MLILGSPREAHRWSAGEHLAGRAIGFVPTMGALHTGHLALIAEAHSRADTVAVSIFVNPLQFNRPDDFRAYPRPLDADLETCRAAGVAAVYAPDGSSMYAPGFETHVEPGETAALLEGAMRPGHFRGVTTVVAKLFNAVQPHVAVFGEKDYQQLAVIRRMVADLDFAVEIVGLPTVREADGLAVSSRNRRLSSEQRRGAVVVPRALRAISDAVTAGEDDVSTLLERATSVVGAEPLATLEYLQIVDPLTLAPLERIDGQARALIAAWFGQVRLIDNCAVPTDAFDRPVAG